MKNKKSLKAIIIAIIIAILSVAVYKNAIAPKLYDKYLNEGIKYLMNEQYEEAILSFNKAIKIEAKSTEARVYQAKAYIGNEEIDKAVDVLKEAQEIDNTNEELLMEILEIIAGIDGDLAHEFIDRYIDAVGTDNISQEIKDLLEIDRAELNNIVNKVQDLYDNAVEGSEEGQYEVGSKADLLNVIKEAKELNKNLFANQDEINSMVDKVNKAKTNFEKGKVEPFPKDLANKYLARISSIEANAEAKANAFYNDPYAPMFELRSASYERAEAYISLLYDIYNDLNKYLPPSKKSAVQNDKNKFESEKYKLENVDLPPEMVGTGTDVDGTLGVGYLAEKHCINLINQYMK